MVQDSQEVILLPRLHARVAEIYLENLSAIRTELSAVGHKIN
jgi:hypothetical protein